jgi:type IV pilus assembly protein PilB
MDKEQKRLGEILIEKGLINQEQLLHALELQKRNKEFLGKILIESGRIEEKDLLEALSGQFAMPLVSLKDKYIDWDLVKQFSPSLILDYRCFPIARDERSVTVAINNPLDAWPLQKATEEARGLSLSLKLVLVCSGDMEEVLRRYQEYMRGNISKLLE